MTLSVRNSGPFEPAQEKKKEKKKKKWLQVCTYCSHILNSRTAEDNNGSDRNYLTGTYNLAIYEPRHEKICPLG